MYKPLLLLSALVLSTQAQDKIQDQEKPHVHSHGGTGPCIHNKDEFFTGHLHNINNFDFNEGGQEVLKTHTHFDAIFNFNEHISLYSVLNLERDHSHAAGHDHGAGEEESYDDEYFENNVLYLEQLYLDITLNDSFAVQVGKMNIPIGFGMHEYMGYYGYEVQEALYLREKIAINLNWKNELDNGAVLSIDASTFFADTTVNDSVINDREGAPKNSDAAGASNTDDFSSYAIGARLDNLYFMTDEYIHEFSFVTGFALQAEATESDEHGDDEERWILGGKYTIHFDDVTSLTLLNETMDISSWGGENEADLMSITSGAQINHNNWHFGGTYTDYLHDHEEADEEHNGRLLQISAGYTFNNGIGIDLGYQKIKEAGDEDDREGPGIAVSYHLDF